eukprot:GFYU01006246.1.p1 GENE.GFYU01006246.1~~GFYU01006246.1.p1  ORF type:complete len:927 (+),score=190.47 GFYU01006246.1:414-2783(+)
MWSLADVGLSLSANSGTYNYIWEKNQDMGASFAIENITPLIGDAFHLYDTYNQTTVFAGTFDARYQMQMQLLPQISPQALPSFYSPVHKTGRYTVDDSKIGIFTLGKDSWIIMQNPVVQSTLVGPPRGVLLIARRMSLDYDRFYVKLLSKSCTTIVPVTELTGDMQEVYDSLVTQEYSRPQPYIGAWEFRTTRMKDIPAASMERRVCAHDNVDKDDADDSQPKRWWSYTILADPAGRPAVMMRVDGHRAIYELERDAILFSAITLGSVMILLTGVFSLLLRRFILRRLQRLNTMMQERQVKSPSLTRKGENEVKHKDEIDLLKTNMNNMMEVIDEMDDPERALDLQSPAEQARAILDKMVKSDDVSAETASQLRKISLLVSSQRAWHVDVVGSLKNDTKVDSVAKSVVMSTTQLPMNAGSIIFNRVNRRKTQLNKKLSTSVEAILGTVDKLTFDVFELKRESKNMELVVLSNHLFQRCSFDELGISAMTFNNFIEQIQKQYQSNPYHNATHGADVMQTSYWYLLQNGFEHIPLEQKFCLLLAAACHDVDHNARNNAWHVTTGSDLAVLYNDRAVLENHHCHVAFKTMTQKGCNVLENFDREPRAKIRSIVVNLILQTDMSEHFDSIAQLRSALKERDETELSSELLLGAAIKCSDIGHPTKEQHLHVKWSELVEKEFLAQGADELKRGIEPLPFMNPNRGLEDCYKSQVGFIQFVAKPLLELVAVEIVGGRVGKKVIKNINKNIRYWKGLLSTECGQVSQSEDSPDTASGSSDSELTQSATLQSESSAR